MISIRHLGALLLVLLPAIPTLPSDGESRRPEGRGTGLTSGVQLPGELHALATAESGALAFATPRERGGRIGSSVTVRSASGEEQRSHLNLRLRDLIWLSDGRLLAVAFRAERRTRGEAFLLLWDPGKSRFKRVMRLPPTARDLTHTDTRESLLLTARNELRVITLPSLRSGPLYRVPGDNRAAVALGEGRVLVAQSDAMLLIDLDDRQSRERMPVRERLTVGVPVEHLTLAADGTTVLAELLDGSVRRIRQEPLRVEAESGGRLLPAIPAPAPAAVKPMAPPPPPEPPSDDPLQPPRAEPPADSPPSEVALTVVPPPPGALRSPAPQQETGAPPVEPASPTSPGPDSAIHGRLTGPARGSVSAVVAFGPDSLLREAARVSPAADGSFDLGPLPGGRYRVQLDAGGGTLLVSDPAFHLVDVSEDPSSSLGFRVLQAN